MNEGKLLFAEKYCGENTVEPPNNGQVGDGHFVNYSEVFPSLEVPPPSTLKLLSHFKNDIAYTLDVNSMSWSIELVECGLLLCAKVKETIHTVNR